MSRLDGGETREVCVVAGERCGRAASVRASHRCGRQLQTPAKGFLSISITLGKVRRVSSETRSALGGGISLDILDTSRLFPLGLASVAECCRVERGRDELREV